MENDLGGTRLGRIKSNYEINKEVQVKNDYPSPTLDNSRRNKKDIDGLQGRTF